MSAVSASTIQMQQLYNDSEFFMPNPSKYITSKVHVHRPMPWPSFMVVYAGGDEARPLPWPSFSKINGCEFPNDVVEKSFCLCISDSFHAKEREHYFCSCQPWESPIRNSMRWTVSSYDQFSCAIQDASYWPGYFLTNGLMQFSDTGSAWQLFLGAPSASLLLMKFLGKAQEPSGILLHVSKLAEVKLIGRFHETGSWWNYVMHTLFSWRLKFVMGLEIIVLACVENGQDNLQFLMVPVVLEQEAFNIGLPEHHSLEILQADYLPRWAQNLPSTNACCGAISIYITELHDAHISQNLQFPYSAISRGALLILIQSTTLKYMDLGWFTSTILTEIFSAWFSLNFLSVLLLRPPWPPPEPNCRDCHKKIEADSLERESQFKRTSRAQSAANSNNMSWGQLPWLVTISAYPACTSPYCSSLKNARESGFWDSQKLELNNWVPYMVKLHTDMSSYGITLGHIRVREEMHFLDFKSKEEGFAIMDTSHDASKLNMGWNIRSIEWSSKMQVNAETWVLVVCNRLKTLSCALFSTPWDPGGVLAHSVIRASRPCFTLTTVTIAQTASSNETVLGKELGAPWDRDGHMPRSINDGGLRASWMLRRGECHGPCGLLYLDAWAVTRSEPQDQCTRGEGCHRLYLRRSRVNRWGGRRT